MSPCINIILHGTHIDPDPCINEGIANREPRQATEYVPATEILLRNSVDLFRTSSMTNTIQCEGPLTSPETSDRRSFDYNFLGSHLIKVEVQDCGAKMIPQPQLYIFQPNSELKEFKASTNSTRWASFSFVPCLLRYNNTSKFRWPLPLCRLHGHKSRSLRTRLKPN